MRIELQELHQNKDIHGYLPHYVLSPIGDVKDGSLLGPQTHGLYPVN